MTSNSTVIFTCGDGRLHSRKQVLHENYAFADGHPPFWAVLPGGCLPYQTDESLKMALWPYLKKGATHVHLEDHMGAAPEVPGCAAYLLRHTDKHDGPYSWNLEKQDHITQLGEAAFRIHDFARREGHLISVSAGLYSHDKSGVGEFMLTTDIGLRFATADFTAPRF